MCTTKFMMLEEGKRMLLTIWVIFTEYLVLCNADEICQTGRYDKKTCKYGCCSSGAYFECCKYTDAGLIAGVVLAGIALIIVAVVAVLVVKKQLSKNDKQMDGVIVNTEATDTTAKQSFNVAKLTVLSSTDEPSSVEPDHGTVPGYSIDPVSPPPADVAMRSWADNGMSNNRPTKLPPLPERAEISNKPLER